MSSVLSTGGNDCFRQPGCVLGMLDSLCVRFAVNELQRVNRDHLGIQFLAVTIIEKFLQALIRADPKMIIAVPANLQIVFQLAFVEMFATLFAAYIDVLSAHDPFCIAHGLSFSFLL